ncbi:MAG: SIMPL domain-containing protein [Flavobacteriales bacterium]
MKHLLILALALCAGTLTATSQMNTPLSLVTTTGKATVYAQPDEALISFTVSTSDNDISEAKRKNADISRSTISFLKNEGIKEEHIQTQYLTVGKNYRHDRNPQEQKFQATQNFSVCVSNLDDLEEIMTGLLELEITNLGSPQFRSTELEKHKDEARIKAIENAKHKAELMTAALGQTVGKAHSITEAGPQNNNFRMAYAADAESMRSGGGGGDSFAVGQLEVTSEITISFVLK